MRDTTQTSTDALKVTRLGQETLQYGLVRLADAERLGMALFARASPSGSSSSSCSASTSSPFCGTMLHLDAAGSRTSPDETWNDGFGAGAGGSSSSSSSSSLFFARPAFQDPVRAVVGDRRGTPDISMSAAVNGAAVTYYSYDPANVGYHLVGGTSEASRSSPGLWPSPLRSTAAASGTATPPCTPWASPTCAPGSSTSPRTTTPSAASPASQPPAATNLATGLGTVNVTDFATALAQQTGRPALTQ